MHKKKLIGILTLIALLIAVCLPAIAAENGLLNNIDKYLLKVNIDTLKAAVQDIFSKSADEVKQLAAKFKDTGSHWSGEWVGRLVALGAINGYPDGSFKPDNTITRAEFAKTLCTALKLELHYGYVFDDVPESHWANTYIFTLARTTPPIINENEYGKNYKPDEPITRVEIAKMVVRAMGLEDEAKNPANRNTGFADNSSIAAADRGYVKIAKEKGIINGYPDGTFRPQQTAKRGEAAKMVVAMLAVMTGYEDILPPVVTPEVPPIEEPDTVDVINGFNVYNKDKHNVGYYLERPGGASPLIELNMANKEGLEDVRKLIADRYGENIAKQVIEKATSIKPGWPAKYEIWVSQNEEIIVASIGYDGLVFNFLKFD